MAALLILLVSFTSCAPLQQAGAQDVEQNDAFLSFESSEVSNAGISDDMSDVQADLDEFGEVQGSKTEGGVSDESKLLEKQIDSDKAYIEGKYICASNYHMQDFSIDYPETIPFISFSKDGSCELFVNYLGGLASVFGSYTIEEDEILVAIDLSSAISDDEVFDMHYGTSVIVEKGANPNLFQEGDKKYMDDQYVFSIISGDKIIIDRGFYTVNAGDAFLKSNR